MKLLKFGIAVILVSFVALAGTMNGLALGEKREFRRNCSEHCGGDDWITTVDEKPWGDWHCICLGDGPEQESL